MQAIILAGGMGTRLRPLTYTLPKPMLPVANQPVLGHIIRQLAAAGCSEVIITTNYLAEVVENGLAALGLPIPVHCVQEDIPLGTAGCVKNLIDRLDNEFFVIQGDAVAEVDYAGLTRFHRDHEADATITVMKVQDPREFGIVDLDEDGRIGRFQEKPRIEEAFSDLANAGFYLLKKELFDLVPAGVSFDFSKQLFPLLLEQDRRLFACRLRGFWVDIGRVNTYLNGNQHLISGRAEVAPGVEVPTSATLLPPFLIGARSSIGDHCVIGPGTVIGDHCQIGPGSTIIGSVLMNDVVVGGGCRLNDCVVASRNRIGQEVVVSPRAVIGEGCDIGAGAQVGAYSRVGPAVPISARTVVEGLVSPRHETLESLQTALASVPVYAELTPEQRDAFALLTEFGEMTATEVSEGSGITPQRVESVLHSLVLRGLVLSTQDYPRRYALTREESRPSRRILFVDDMRDTREFFRLAFSMMGHQTRLAANGREAVEAVRHDRYDAIITDIEMPEMDGWEAVRQIRRLPNGRQVPILVFTAHHDAEISRLAQEAGADSVLYKPMLPQDVWAQVQCLLTPPA